MNKICSLITILLVSISTYGQTYEELIAAKSCDCIAELELMPDLKQSLIKCITSSKSEIHANDKDQVYERPSTVEGIRKNFKDVSDLVIQNCPSLRTKVMEQKKSKFYVLSPKSQANAFFKRGNEFKEQNDYQSAEKEYKKAIKKDKYFVLAHDHLGVSYRFQKKFDEAIDSYEKSLDLFPEGDFALLNIAAVYSLKENDKKAIEYYLDLANFYPENPEGYYGIGKSNLLLGDNESALKNALTALILYKNQKSDKITDSEKLIELVRMKMERDGEMELFDKIMKEFGVTHGE
ncbi:tetratricopeptide repeat protein [uncultured Dokdonia sp.]|uniref:tetratricopeptide repeat protein n=1 Tax=uncultured Dokdonia sp. TaxID=575653 RepID=UPI002603724F|nr:tetratricopeptide repeat protein [uncultured Dokdonia sp.]